MVALQVEPPLVLYSMVPPMPVTEPIVIDPPVTIQLVHMLLTIARLPVGGAGGVQLAGEVTPTEVLLLLQPLLAKTLASMVMGVI